MHFEWSIDIGTVLQIAAMFASVVGLIVFVSNRLKVFEVMLQQHANTLVTHDARIVELMGQVARLVGRGESAH